MTKEDATTHAFLYQLFTATVGDPDNQAASHDIGAALGLEPDESGEIAQNLCIMGFAELKTLSGDVGITVQGLKEINQKAPAGSSAATASLSQGPVLDPEDIKTMTSILEAIKEKTAPASLSYEKTEEIVIDIKTIEIQMLSPRPKTEIIKATLQSLKQGLSDLGDTELMARIDGLVSS